MQIAELVASRRDDKICLDMCHIVMVRPRKTDLVWDKLLILTIVLVEFGFNRRHSGVSRIVVDSTILEAFESRWYAEIQQPSGTNPPVMRDGGAISLYLPRREAGILNTTFTSGTISQEDSL